MTRSVGFGLWPIACMFALIAMAALVLSGPVFVEEVAKVELPALQARVQSTQIQLVQFRAQPAQDFGWVKDKPVLIPPGYVINGHAAKHQGEALDAWKIYALLLEGNCVASTVWCGNGMERLYLCVSPDGLIGGLFVVGNEVMSGFGARESYWESRLESDAWRVCQ